MAGASGARRDVKGIALTIQVDDSKEAFEAHLECRDKAMEADYGVREWGTVVLGCAVTFFFSFFFYGWASLPPDLRS